MKFKLVEDFDERVNTALYEGDDTTKQKVVYSDDGKTLVKYNDKEAKVFSIPKGVTSIGGRAFASCDNLVSITIPDSVISIGYAAFYGCSSITEIVIPDGVTSMGHGAFQYCASLTSVVIGDGVTTIDNWAFAHCSSLTSVTIGDSVTEIGYYAFENCSSLTSITIPDNVTSIGEDAFRGCDALISVVVSNPKANIARSAFQGCPKLTNARIDDKIKPIQRRNETKFGTVPTPYNKYLEIVPEEELDIDWHAKECSYDIAKEIVQSAKRALRLPAHEVEMLEHDINNLRSDEWVEDFFRLSMKSKARDLFFKYAVERDEYGAGDKIDDVTIQGTLAAKEGYEDIFDSWYFLTDDPDFPVVEIVHDRLYPVELPEDLNESFSKEFESRELLDTGELISALKALVKEYGHMELEKEIYLETVENEHGRQLKIGHSSI